MTIGYNPEIQDGYSLKTMNGWDWLLLAIYPTTAIKEGPCSVKVIFGSVIAVVGMRYRPVKIDKIMAVWGQIQEFWKCLDPSL